MKRPLVACIAACTLTLLARQHLPAQDATVDWLLDQAVPATQPATQPATAPAPFADRTANQGVPSRITYSDGSTLVGRVNTTPGKPVRVWDEDEKEYRDVPLHLITSLTARVLWERQQEEWQFRESGSDIKVFTGQSYPARETEYAVELVNGQEIIGGIVAPLYLDTPEGRRTIVLHKRAKGALGQALSDLVYVRRVELGEGLDEESDE
jgi:hypothetical protein